MNDLEKYELINSCETTEELQAAILKLADENGVIQGRSKSFKAAIMAELARGFILDKTGALPSTVITRNWGLRQQAIYIKHY